MGSPEFVELQNLYRKVSRQVEALDDSTWGNVLAQFLRKAIVAANDERDLFKRSLDAVCAEENCPAMTAGEKLELATTTAKLNALLQRPKFRPGPASYTLLFGTTVGQYYLYVPMIIPHALWASLGRTHIGAQIARGAAFACHGYVCAVNYPMNHVFSMAEGFDRTFHYVRDRFKADLAKRELEWQRAQAQKPRGFFAAFRDRLESDWNARQRQWTAERAISCGSALISR